MSDKNLRIGDPTVMVGGQAVIEGVMMRAKNKIATAVRRTNGKIEIKTEDFTPTIEKYKWLNVPIIRGAINLFEMMSIGVKTLQYSAEIAMEDEREKIKRRELKIKERKNEVLEKISLIGTMIFAIGLGIGIFFVLPLFLATKVFNIEQKAVEFNLVSGAIRTIFFITYIWLISQMKDIKRIFQYHGAEHKAVFNYEANIPLTIENASKFTTYHPRCGTSFLVALLAITIFSFSILDAILITIFGKIDLYIRLLSHLPFIPVVAGIGYEALRFSAKNQYNPIVRIMIAPGLWVQRITTQPPDEKQLEVALVALKAALGYNEEEIYQVREMVPHKELTGAELESQMV